MDLSEQKQFGEMLRAIAEIHGRQLSGPAIAIYLRTLEGYSLQNIKAAISAHERDPEEGRFFPTPAHLMKYLKPADGRPGADEMWAIMPKSESDSVVWTQEAANAYFQAALPLIEDGDMTGARMAFRDAYNRQCEESRRLGRPISWNFSEGDDKQHREIVMADAVRLGRIPLDRALQCLPCLDVTQFANLVTSKPLSATLSSFISEGELNGKNNQPELS